MKVKLPFVVQPRYAPKKTLIGTEDSGQFEIERRGYLTVQEKSFTQAALKENGNGNIVKLLNDIGKKCGKSSQQVLEDLKTYKAGEGSYLDEFEAELIDLSQDIEVVGMNAKLIQATALMMSRYDPSWDFNNTLELHPDILDSLAVLYSEEDNKSVEALIEDIDEDEVAPSSAKEESGKVSKPAAKVD